ncbi:MAG: protein arginine kinase [Planctomycetota bacterium]|jgi:protein arginine kinase
MNIDDLTQSTGEWLSGDKPDSGVVISSRIRLARNLNEYPFLSAARDSDKTDIYRNIAEAMTRVPELAEGLLVDLEQAGTLDRRLLVERHLISRQHASAKGSRGVAMSRDEKSSLMINEEDHLRIQSLRSGLQLEALWQEVSEVDDILGGILDLAFDKQFGYLTACPTNVGTGIRVSVMLHLPALKLAKEIDRVIRAARDMRLAVRGLYGEGTDAAGDLYQVSNQTTLGKTEEEIINSFGNGIIPKIVQYEMTARESLARQRPYQLDDKIWRAYGIVRNARCISSEEMLVLLSPIRMGIEMGRFDKLDIATLNELFLFTQSAHLQKMAGKSMDGEARGIARAEYVREKLA